MPLHPPHLPKTDAFVVEPPTSAELDEVMKLVGVTDNTTLTDENKLILRHALAYSWAALDDKMRPVDGPPVSLKFKDENQQPIKLSPYRMTPEKLECIRQQIDVWERAQNVWMKVSRGDIPARFDKIKDTYLEVAADSRDQIDREHVILNVYRDFRGALKSSEVLAIQVLNKAEGVLDAQKAALQAAADAITNAGTDDREALARLELRRDTELRKLQQADERYQIAKDLADNLTVSYNTSETVMARLMQTTHAKERVYSQAVMFFGTNETVFTALSASFTGLHGLHESTETLKAMKEGVSQSLEVLAEVGGKVQEEAIKEGYGPTIRADAVKALVDSVVNFQERSVQLIDEMRDAATRNAEEVRQAVEDGKRRLAVLANQGNALPIDA
ncbi:MAG: cell surface protein [Pseudomonadota bacterium]